ncbi:MAG: GNAT family N-acetyltransferase [Legionellales bacterium]|nr:GNAT family N-acetyltransferase [Legionellales bacterium]
MIRFKLPTAEEKQQLIDHSIEEYAQDLFRVKEFSTLEAARKGSRDEVMGYIHQEKNPDNDRIYLIYSDVLHVGYMWFKMEPRYHISVLLYIYVFPKFRRHGFAREALKLFEKESRELGALQTQLVAFLDNHSAVTMYEKAGYIGVEEFTLYNAPIDTRRRMAKMLISL